jgi:hypothetical protein
MNITHHIVGYSNHLQPSYEREREREERSRKNPKQDLCLFDDDD